MLVTAGVSDPRVPYWEPLKWVARARSLRQGPSALLLRTENTGHAGAPARDQRYREIAFQYAFILDRMGMSGVRPDR
jgi:oligopeptidase B